MTSTAALPSSPSTPASSSTDPDADGSEMHSPVPMVAGALAGFIAILAAIITVIVLRRKKQRAMSRGTGIHPQTIGSTAAFDSGTILLRLAIRSIFVLQTVKIDLALRTFIYGTSFLSLNFHPFLAVQIA